ncbi:putative acyl-CoA desaturase [Helianthus annuus]|uniref:Acyl-CoA desaturase n=2 Tax=Helianthus annuus TaxID=4232 RepID=A0A9K3JMS2_HELAN|nr:putative acyl-CoA desaturase [Helianthus annuus]KAJ0951161.1 putative acyl-CoA desaturase [Helianthus annuus]
MITVSGSLNDTEYGKIPLSNVMVTRKKNLFMGRTWRTLDIQTSLGILVRDPIVWVSIHRYHHQYVDSEKDPHSPIFGFWFSHMGWLFDSGYILEKYQEHKNVDDLKKQAFYRFIKMTYTLHLFVFTALVYVFGGFTYLVWVVGVSTTLLYQCTFLVNSVCHIWGNQAWNNGDLSKNNWWVALVTFGEGWHNNHHVFEYSARYRVEWWQIDVGWYTIRFLEVVGLATNVKLPTEAHKLKKSVASLNKFK